MPDHKKSNRWDRRHPEQVQARRWASLEQAAKYLGISVRTVRVMGADGRLTLYRNGPRILRVDLNEVDAAMRPQGE
jgi:excisionase family DNA binding protein